MRAKSWFFTAWIVTLLLAEAGLADVSLPAIIDNHMVLQSGVKAPIWGLANPGEEVSVSFAGQTKKTVGDRLAGLALHHTYGKDVVWTGPRFLKATRDGSCVRVSFTHIDQGLEASDGQAPNWFELAGADKKFVPAQAKIDGDQVVVSSPEISAPEYIRMAWNNIAEQNLRDKNGWPAFSFSAEVSK